MGPNAVHSHIHFHLLKTGKIFSAELYCKELNDKRKRMISRQRYSSQNHCS